MYPISVSTNQNGDILIKQEWNDINEPDPEITVSPEQAGLVASWIFRAATESSETDEELESIPIQFYSRGPESELENLKVYNNANGMIILSIDEDTFIEVSPAMAKRIRDQLSKAISVAFTDMLRSDDEV